MTAARPIVIVMVKAPVAGTVKTRLQPIVSPEDAARLATAFVRDVVGGIRRAGLDVRIVYAPPDGGRDVLEPLLPPGLHWSAQQGHNLGERMDRAMSEAQAEGFGPLVVIGTDSPTLPTEYVMQAFAALDSGDTDIVLGPTDDGGYYLIGAAQHVPGLFENVAWSTAQTFRDTVRSAEQLGLCCLTLSPWYDIDTPEDLSRLGREIGDDPELARRAPATAAWLRSHPAVSSAGDGHPQTNA